MACEKRIRQTLESCSSAGGNEIRDAGVAGKHYFFIVIKTVEVQKKSTINFKNRFQEGHREVLSS
jgi:hypothetical protein